MNTTPHYGKLKAALNNKKCPAKDKKLLRHALEVYDLWIEEMEAVETTGRGRVFDLVDLLNWYKDEIEVETIAKKGSPFIKRQKGQLKIDNSIMEEFLVHLVAPYVKNKNLIVGPQRTFTSMAFCARSVNELPEVHLQTKSQDFAISKRVEYALSNEDDIVTKSFNVPLVTAECKTNLDKTMLEGAIGMASNLKDGLPLCKYFLLVEYLDMSIFNCTPIDNIFLLRHASRLQANDRTTKGIEKQHKDYPIDPKVMWDFTKEIASTIKKARRSDQVLERGSFRKVG